MKAENYDSGEFDILEGMLISESVLGTFAPSWNRNFDSSICNHIGQLAIDCYKAHKKAPRRQIHALFREWAEGKDPDTIGLGEHLLAQIPADTYKMNGEYPAATIIDLAAKRFNRNRLNKLKEEIEADCTNGQVERALNKVSGFRKLELGEDGASNFFADPEEWSYPFHCQQDEHNIVELPGVLGLLFYDCLVREGFAAFAGPQKSGKSFWLSWLAFQAMCQRRRVAYFQIGDMSKREIQSRFHVLTARHPKSPTKKSKYGWPCVVDVPAKIIKPTGDNLLATIEYEPKTFNAPLSLEQAEEARQRLVNNTIKSNRSYFVLYSYSNFSKNILDIRAKVEALIKEGWTPDVIVIDYADNLAPVDKRKETRDQVNETWGHMSAMRIDFHCLLVTATQVKATGFKAPWLGPEHFSEDNRKLNHVSSFHGINMTDDEREIGCCRLNTFKGRKVKSSQRKGAYVAQCLELANPAVLSTW